MEKARQNLTQKGITLVALVVTIIVLLILAGITIDLLFNDNGIIKRAQDARNAWENGETKEQEEMKNSEEILNHYTNGQGGSNGGNIPVPSPLPSDGSYSEVKKVNTPKLGEGMTPIKWDATANGGAGDWVETIGSDKDWYNYIEGDKKWANAKTKDVYSSATTSGSDTQSSDYTTARAKYGDAVYETSSTHNSTSGSWHGDYAIFPFTRYPFFLCGGACSSGSSAGLFCFNGDNGDAYRAYGFRPVLVVL